MAVKAIETRYKGYRFRSRTEARWAVFFDALGIEWIYEVEGYRLEGVGRYLPDFKLTIDNDYVVEIKGVEPTKQEKKKICLACEGLDKHGLLISGVPGPWPECQVWQVNRDGMLAGPTDLDSAFDITKARCEKAIVAARSARFEHGESPK